MLKKKIMLPKLVMKWEKWRWNEEYGIFVSNFGRFRDKDKEDIPIKILDRNGYVYVKTKHGSRPAHRLVMLTWKPIEDRENFTVDHLDHNKRNNAVENLEWVTAYENTDRAKADTIKEEAVAVGTLKVICAIHKKNNQEKMFSSVEEAVDFICDKAKITNKKGKETVKRCIAGAAATNGEYNDWKWRYV